MGTVELIVSIRHAHEYTDLGTEAGTGIARVLQGMPSHFQEEAFLGIRIFGFERRKFEEFRIEAGGVAQEATPPAVFDVLGIKSFAIPSLRGHL